MTSTMFYGNLSKIDFDEDKMTATMFYGDL